MMLHRLLSLFATVALLTAAAPPPASGLEGNWRNTRDTVRIRVAPCGAAMCGTVIWANDTARADAKKGSGRDLVGSMLLTDLRQGKDGLWRGKVFIPDINSKGSATVTELEGGEHIRISGCVFLGLACRTQHWHRIG
jgi:uncharacterized protein (DUF2147 family)